MGLWLRIVWAHRNSRADDIPQPELLNSSCVEGWQLGLLSPDTAQDFCLTLERFLSRLSAFSGEVIGVTGHSDGYDSFGFCTGVWNTLLTKACILKGVAVKEEGQTR